MVFIGTSSGLTRYWSVDDHRLQRFAYCVLYETKSSVCVRVCVCVCVCVLCSLRTASFEWICTKFGMWHRCTLQMVMGLAVSCGNLQKQ